MTETSVRTTCPYCGVGCGIIAKVRDDSIIAVEGDPAHPANRGKLCVKGTSLPKTQDVASRLLHPEVNGKKVTWEDAISTVASGFKETIDKFGPESVAFYLSGQLLTEDYYVANKLMKGFIGSANVDTNSRLCMSSAVAAYKRAFGEDVVPCEYQDFEQAELFVFVGSNAAWTHPVIFQRIAAVRERGAKVIVVDPRRTATCDIADLHLPIAPGGDVALFNGLLSYIAANDFLDQPFIDNHTTGFASALTEARLSLAEVAAMTGLEEQLIVRFYEAFCRSEKVLTLFSQGVNQSVDGTDKGNAIINCHLATGRIGKIGAGPFSLTGQPNAMGGREVGGMANQLAAHLDLDEQGCEIASAFWQAPNMVKNQGRKAVDMFADIESGKIKAVWIMATNPAVSLPNSEAVTRALKKCPLVVVSDVTHTDTTAFADVLLPASGWGEKDGTVTNSERFLSRQRAVVPAPGEARADWRVICQVAAALGFEDAFAYHEVSDVFAEHARFSGYRNEGGRLFNISEFGQISREDYDLMVPRQWPQQRPFATGQFQTPDGRANFIAVENRMAALANRQSNRLTLNTGRIRDQWHTMTRTGNAAALYQHQAIAWLDISQADADRHDLQTGDLCQLRQGSDTANLPVRVNEAMTSGQVFVPMHWSDKNSSHGRVNRMVPAVTDPISGQPALKSASVALTSLPTYAWVEVCCEPTIDVELSHASGVSFWSVARDEGCLVYQVAVDAPEGLNWLLELVRQVTSSSKDILFEDSLTGVIRGRGYAGDQLAWTLQSNQRLAEARATGLSGPDDDEIVWQDLSILAVPPGANSPRICTCFEVSEYAISQAILAGVDTTEALGKTLKCGTNCGSCVPEINRLITQLTQKTQERESFA